MTRFKLASQADAFQNNKIAQNLKFQVFKILCRASNTVMRAPSNVEKNVKISKIKLEAAARNYKHFINFNSVLRGWRIESGGTKIFF